MYEQYSAYVCFLVVHEVFSITSHHWDKLQPFLNGRPFAYSIFYYFLVWKLTQIHRFIFIIKQHWFMDWWRQGKKPVPEANVFIDA